MALPGLMMPPGLLAIQGGESDPYWEDVILLMRFNNSFADVKGHTVTASGSPTFDTGKFGSAVYFAQQNHGQYLHSSNIPALGTNNFTIELWVYPMTTGDSNGGGLFDFRGQSKDAEPHMRLYPNGSWTLLYNDTIVLNGSVATSQWHHVALTRAGSTGRFFINGTQQGSNLNFGSSHYSRTHVTLGSYVDWRNTGTGGKIGCKIDEFRVTLGVARYTSAFDVPTKPFPNK